MTGNSRVKMETVAHAAGVSQSLVSKVLNDRPGVSADTRLKVLRVLAQTGYQRRPRVRQARTVEVVFRTITSAINPPLLRGLAQSLRTSGYSLTITAGDADHNPGWLDAVISRRPAGAILVVAPVAADMVNHFDQAGIPVVVLDTVGDAPPAMHVVGSTQWRGGYLATRHLLELGHCRIGMISGPPHLACSVARISGYHAALKESGLAIDPVLIRSGRFQGGPARARTHDLLNLPVPPTAIVAGNDLQALGVIDACHDRGLRVPDDLSIVGYDDQDAAASAVPALTTVHQPLVEMAAESGRILQGLIADPGQAPIRIDLLADLVFRKTTAPPPARRVRSTP